MQKAYLSKLLRAVNQESTQPLPPRLLKSIAVSASGFTRSLHVGQVFLRSSTKIYWHCKWRKCAGYEKLFEKLFNEIHVRKNALQPLCKIVPTMALDEIVPAALLIKERVRPSPVTAVTTLRPYTSSSNNLILAEALARYEWSYILSERFFDITSMTLWNLCRSVTDPNVRLGQ